jgi:hypothetical protein
MTTTSRLPVALPAHWFAEDDWRGTLIHAADGKGRVLASVTVSEEVRGYLVGVQQVPASCGRAPRYMSRGWRARLYRDALAALMASWRGLQPGAGLG